MKDREIRVLLIEESGDQAQVVRQLLAEGPGPPVELEWTDHLLVGLKRLSQGGVDVVLLDLAVSNGGGLKSFTKTYLQAPGYPSSC